MHGAAGGSGGAEPVRGAEPIETLTFEGAQLTVCVSIGRSGGGTVRLDGWLDPPVRMRVELAGRGPRRHTMSDEGGRFVFDEVHTGDTRLTVHPTPGSGIRLPRRVQTPPFVL